MKNLLIDTRVLGRGNISGIEEYARSIINEFLALPSDYHVNFFYSGMYKSPFPKEWLTARTTLIDWNIPNKLLDISMRVCGIPKVDAHIPSDIVFSPHFNLLPTTNNAKRVITFHDLSFVHFPQLYPMRKQLWHWQQDYARQAASADAIIAVSQFTNDDIVRTLGIPKEKVHTIYSGINPYYKKLESDDEAIPRIIKSKHLHKPFILFVGTIEPRKNISAIIRAFNVLKKSSFHSELQLIIVGKRGWLCDTIFRDAAESPWHKDIVFFGEASYEEVRVLYNITEAFVYPSLFEGFGFPPLEAQACGAPVITSNRSSLPEIVGSSALLVDPWKVEELVDALTCVLTNPSFRAQLIERGYENITRFSWANTAQSLLRVFHTLQ